MSWERGHGGAWRAIHMGEEGREKKKKRVRSPVPRPCLLSTSTPTAGKNREKNKKRKTTRISKEKRKKGKKEKDMGGETRVCASRFNRETRLPALTSLCEILSGNTINSSRIRTFMQIQCRATHLLGASSLEKVGGLHLSTGQARLFSSVGERRVGGPFPGPKSTHDISRTRPTHTVL